jgi:hypothetical protein
VLKIVRAYDASRVELEQMRPDREFQLVKTQTLSPCRDFAAKAPALGRHPASERLDDREPSELLPTEQQAGYSCAWG